MELVDVSGRSRPSDKGGWGGHPDPKIKGGRPSPKKLFSVLRASFWSKSEGAPGLPGAPPCTFA